MKSTGTLKLIDKKTRTVAVYGPLPPNGQRPKLLAYEGYGSLKPHQAPAFCFSAKDRVAKFIVDPGPSGDRLLELLERHPIARARPVQSYGVDGWTLEM